MLAFSSTVKRLERDKSRHGHGMESSLLSSLLAICFSTERDNGGSGDVGLCAGIGRLQFFVVVAFSSCSFVLRSVCSVSLPSHQPPHTPTPNVFRRAPTTHKNTQTHKHTHAHPKRTKHAAAAAARQQQIRADRGVRACVLCLSSAVCRRLVSVRVCG